VAKWNGFGGDGVRDKREVSAHRSLWVNGSDSAAAVSVPWNVAEGHTRESMKEYLYPLSVAQGSLAEVETQIEIAFRFTYCSQEEIDSVLSHSASLEKRLYSLRN